MIRIKTFIHEESVGYNVIHVIAQHDSTTPIVISLYRVKETS